MKGINNLSSILGSNSRSISNPQMSYRADDLRPYTAYSHQGNPYTTNNVLEGRLNIYTNSTDNHTRINQNLSNIGNSTPIPRPCIGGGEVTLIGLIGGALFGIAEGPLGVLAGAITGALGGLSGECIHRALTDPTSSRPENQQRQ